MTFSVPLPVLHAVALFAADKDLRFYLRGVNFRVAGGALLLTATDGNAAIIARLPAEDTTPRDYGTVSRDAIKALPKRGLATITFSETEVSVLIAGSRSTSRLLGGKYPDVARLFPRTHQHDPRPEFDFAYLGRFAKAAEIAKWGRPRLNPNGLGGATVGFDGDAVGLLMPCRFAIKGVDIPLPTAPGWARL